MSFSDKRQHSPPVRDLFGGKDDDSPKDKSLISHRLSDLAVNLGCLEMVTRIASMHGSSSSSVLARI
jgi:hypothetical protein